MTLGRHGDVLRKPEHEAVWLRNWIELSGFVQEALALGWRLVHSTSVLTVYAQGGRYLHLVPHTTGRTEVWWSY